MKQFVLSKNDAEQNQLPKPHAIAWGFFFVYHFFIDLVSLPCDRFTSH